jgi:hypothetical protein
MLVVSFLRDRFRCAIISVMGKTAIQFGNRVTGVLMVVWGLAETRDPAPRVVREP